MNYKTILALIFIFGGVTSAEESEIPNGSKVVATVNGDEVLMTEIDEFLQFTKLVIGPVNFQKRRDEIEKTALEDLIDRRLMLSEFKKRGGEIKPEYLEKLTKDLIDNQFQGNRDLFLEQLKKSNLTEDQVRSRMKEDFISKVFRAESRQEGGVKDQIDPFETWLESLHKKATISIAN